MTTAMHIVCPHCDAINRLPRERLRDGAKCGSCHRPLYEGRPAALDSIARFDRHATHSDIPLLVDFWAIWCGPCRAMAPIFEQAATQLEPDLRLVKVDSDAARQSIQSGETRGLAITGRTRSPGFPDIPTFVESGFAGFDSGGWFGMWAPKNTPREIREKIATDIRAIVVGADWQAIMEAQGYTGVGSSPEEFLAFWKLESERLGKAIERANIRVN